MTRGNIIDLLVRDGQSVVLTDTQCVRLTEIATEVLLFVHEPRSRAELVAHILHTFGPPPDDDLDARLDAVITELAGLGLIRESASASQA